MAIQSLSEADNLLSPDFFSNPYNTFQYLRENDPVHWNALFGFWMVTQYSDVMNVIQDQRFGNTFIPFDSMIASLSSDDLEALPSVAAYIGMFMQGMDPPLHTRQRALIHASFTPRIVERLRVRIDQLVTELIDEIERKGRQFDFIEDLAFPLPSAVIFELLGVPYEHRDAIKRSSEIIATFVALVQPQPGQIRQMANSLQEVADVLKPVIEQRRQSPQNDLLSLLVHAEKDGERLSEHELIILVTMLLFAGHETTSNLLGNGVYALLQHPDQFELLKSNPALIPGAIEEMLRYDPPVQMVPRFMAADVEFNGRHFKKGERVMIGLAAGNRDPQRFSNPDSFDITRKSERILSFGYGVHFCIGAALARMESQAVLRELLKRMPNLRLAIDEASWRPNIAMRGLTSLPLTY